MINQRWKKSSSRDDVVSVFSSISTEVQNTIWLAQKCANQYWLVEILIMEVEVQVIDRKVRRTLTKWKKLEKMLLSLDIMSTMIDATVGNTNTNITMSS